MSARVGIGYDSHRLVDGDSLRLGGVDVPYDRSLDGHSDADVLAHAVTDALLGAAGMGDIGQHFPDSDAQWAGADSMELLGAVVVKVSAAGFAIVNVDCTLILEAPKLGAHRDAMRARLASALAVNSARVNVKATTGEGMGFVGRGEGVAALAIAALDHAD